MADLAFSFALLIREMKMSSKNFNLNYICLLYTSIIGVSGKSNAFEISKKLGLDESFIINAKKFISNNEISFDKLVSNVDNRRKEYENLIIEQREILDYNKKIKEEYCLLYTSYDDYKASN